MPNITLSKTKYPHIRERFLKVLRNPPSVGRGRGKGLTPGTDPAGRRANVALVPSEENRSHGSVMGLKLRRFCSGTQFRYVFY